MDVTPHIEALRADLAATGGIGDENAMRMADQLGRALEPALRLRLLDILSEAAMELNAELYAGQVEVKLSGREVGLAFIEAAAAPEPVSDDEHSARITLRLPERLKGRAESAAAADGVSLNTWLVRAVARSLDGGGGRGPGRRLSGYANS